MTNNSESILDQMFSKDRVIIVAQLSLDNGHCLQPTGFPDIGPCVYTDCDGNERCLIESEQSMANRLESVCMKAPGRWVKELEQLPVIELIDQKEGSLLATNLTESHRIASSHILDGKQNGKNLGKLLMEKIELKDGGKSWALDKRGLLDKAVFAIDPAALLHGFQFMQWEFVGLRQTRLLSARLECRLTEKPDVNYGMVKFDPIQAKPGGTHNNKGQSIAVKSRVVAAKDSISATFDIDVLGLKSLELRADEQEFLLGLALWKIGSFLANRPSFDARSREASPSLRLRADCYLTCGRITWRGTGGASEAGKEDHVVTPTDLVNLLPSKSPNFKTLVANHVGLNPENSEDGEEEKVADVAENEEQQRRQQRLVYKLRYERKPAATTEPTSPQSDDANTNEGRSEN
jgi:CRISPR-associated protein Csb1